MLNQCVKIFEYAKENSVNKITIEYSIDILKKKFAMCHRSVFRTSTNNFNTYYMRAPLCFSRRIVIENNT